MYPPAGRHPPTQNRVPTTPCSLALQLDKLLVSSIPWTLDRALN